MTFGFNRTNLAILCLHACGFLSVENLFAADSELTTHETSDRRVNNSERVEVVGSRIKRLEGNGPQSVEIIDRQLIERSGATSLYDLIREYSTAANLGGYRPQVRLNETDAAGISGINLRGLGEKNTLVLLNGQRIPANPVISSVDVNLIPVAIVERVEILKDAGSAIYGSDAAGGVVNIVTRSDFKGLETSLKYEGTRDGGGNTSAADVAYGHQGQNLSSTTAFSFKRNDSLEEKQREWSKGGASTYSNPANYREYGNAKAKWHNYSNDPNGAGCDRIDEQGRCVFDPSLTTQYYPQLTQLSGFQLLQYRVTAETSVFARLMYLQNEDIHNRAANAAKYIVPAAVADSINLAPDVRQKGADLEVSLRASALGNREYRTVESLYDVLAGVKGEFFQDWDWTLSASSGKSQSHIDLTNGFALSAKITQLIADGQYNPISPEDSDGIKQAAYKPWEKNSLKTDTAELRLNSPAIGPSSFLIASSFGASSMIEKYESSADSERLAINPKTGESNVLGSKSSGGSGKRSVASIFGEMSAKHERIFEIQAAIRYDSYDDFGSTTNPKLSMAITPVESVILRGSIGSGFKAPPLRRMFQSKQIDVPFVVDYKRCAATGTKADCTSTQRTAYMESNSGLKEEKFNSITGEIVFKPLDFVSASSEVWDTKITGAIPESINWDKFLQLERNGVDISQYGIDVQRIGGDPSAEISQLTGSLRNLNSRHVRGFDMNLGISPKIGNKRLSFESSYSEILFFKEQFLPGQPEEDRAGAYEYPRWRANFMFGFGSGSSDFFIRNERIARHHKLFKTTEWVGDYSQWDLHYAYALQKTKTTLQAGSRNILNTKPPLDDSQQGTVRVSNRLYSALGQTYYVGVKQSF